MKRKLSVLAFSGLLAVGIAAPLSASNASSLLMGGTAAEAVKSAAEQDGIVQKIHHRDDHIWHGDHDPGRVRGPGPALPPWLQHSRHHHRHHWRNNPRPFWDDEDDNSNFTLELNMTPEPRPERRVARRVGLTSEHYRYCEQRYRSYRASDNTFKPYDGARRQCVSPADS